MRLMRTLVGGIMGVLGVVLLSGGCALLGVPPITFVQARKAEASPEPLQDAVH